MKSSTAQAYDAPELIMLPRCSSHCSADKGSLSLTVKEADDYSIVFGNLNNRKMTVSHMFHPPSLHRKCLGYIVICSTGVVKRGLVHRQILLRVVSLLILQKYLLFI